MRVGGWGDNTSCTNEAGPVAGLLSRGQGEPYEVGYLSANRIMCYERAIRSILWGDHGFHAEASVERGVPVSRAAAY